LNKIDLGACHKLVLVAKNSQRGERINAAVISKPFERLIQPLTPSSLADIWDDAEGPYGKNHANGQHLASCVEPLADKKILLVEDNELNRIIACGFLEDFGGVVEVVENGQLAIDKLKEKPEYYDVVLMDIQMPVMDGLTATAIIRREIYLTLPIIAMSAGVLSTEKNRCIDAGMDDFVPKPVDANELLRVILRHIFKSEVNDTVNGTPITDVGLGNDLSIAVSSSLSESGSCSAYESFDPSRVLALTRGKPERLSQVSISLKEFVDSNVTPVLQGRQALQDNNYEQAKFVFHSLKGVVGNYGAVVLKQEIQTLEGEIVSGFSLSALESRLAVVEKELANFIGEAKLWLASARP
jgi:CheY-like chemotaxis protein/HPt (histidine-containing phosphotransfer) domain-containing protein